MSDLIDRQAAIDALDAACVKYDISPHYDDKRSDKEKFFDWWDMHKVLSMQILNNLPSAQPEIIRCKDCDWWTKQEDSVQGRCELMQMYPAGGWYCGNARRRKE